jgi:chromosome segregation ATPase
MAVVRDNSMFNNDFFELKKALETVTLEVTDLKNQLHKKDIEIAQLKQNLRNSNTEDYRERAIRLDVSNNELTVENNQLKQKITKLKGEIQELNDRLAGLVKEKQVFVNTDSQIKTKVVDLDIAKNELRIENGQLTNKIIDLTGKIQELKDQIAGLNRENDNLKREAIARQMVSKTFDGMKNFVGNLKNKSDKSDEK